MINVIPREYFSGGRNIAEDPDAKRELADLIIEMQQAINAGGGGGGVWGVEPTYVDGGRTDPYTEDGTQGMPFKTLQAGLTACPRGGIVKVAKHTYVENVVAVADKQLDADPGTLLRSASGTTLTLTDDAVPLASEFPIFWRGINIQGEDPAGFGVHVKGTGTWMPILVLLDQLLISKNGAGHVWCEGGGGYLTDAGGADGDANVCCRIGKDGTTVGGMLITGRYNLGCADGGVVFQMYEGASVDASECSLSNSGSGMGPATAVIVEMHGHDTPGTGMNFTMKGGTSGGGSSWGSYVKATGSNVGVDIACDFGQSWGQFDGDVFDMEGGYLRINDGVYSSQSRRIFRCGRNLPAPTQMNLDVKNIFANGNGAGLLAEFEGNFNGQLYDCFLKQTNPGAAGTVKAAITGSLQLIDGAYHGPGPVVDFLTGHLWLTGGVDLVPTAGGIPGGVPLAVGVVATVHRGHCNFRSGTPIIAGIEDILPSNFGTVGYGPAVLRVRKGSGPGLPGPGAGYGMGSEFTVVPVGPGRATVYVNLGTEGAPNWVEDAYVVGDPTKWAGASPTTISGAMDRLVSAVVARTIGGAIP